MINLPKLDDQLYSEIVSNARRKIPRLIPEWTDFNAHDPGITLLELFSWLKEMQQYHLDRVTDTNKLKFLKLLGIYPEMLQPARTQVVVENNQSEFIIPRGARLVCGDLVYESTDRVWVHTYSIASMIAYDTRVYADVSNVQSEYDISFYAFGEEPKEGCILYLGAEAPFMENRKYRLWFRLFDDYLVRRNPPEAGESLKLNSIVWEILQAGEWVEIPGLRDGTDGFAHDGSVEFELDRKNEKSRIGGCEKELYWLRARLKKPGCEESPKLRDIFCNYIPVRQAHTLSEVHEFSLAGKEASYTLDTWLSLHGRMEVQVGGADCGWRTLEDSGPALVSVEKDDENACCHIQLKLEEEEGQRVRFICFEPAFELLRTMGSSSGMPHQKFPLYDLGRVLQEELMIQVEETDKAGKRRWYDWKCVRELNSSGGTERCFSVDNAAEHLYFGDNENDRIPPAGGKNIRIVSCSTSRGTAGNVNRGEINRMPDIAVIAGADEERFTCRNINDCVGGVDDELAEQAVYRLKKILRTPRRAVTIEDYEYLTYITPGLRIAKVKAVSMPDKDVPAVKVVVLPFSLKERPRPDREYIEAVRRHLEKYRLVGTGIEVIEPQYIEISIYAEIVPSYMVEDPEGDIVREINTYLSSTGEPVRRMRRNIGDPVFESDIISLINSLDSVSYVKKVSISAHGNGWRKSQGGDIHIPYNALVFPGQHEINILDF